MHVLYYMIMVLMYLSFNIYLYTYVYMYVHMYMYYLNTHHIYKYYNISTLYGMHINTYEYV